MIWFKRYIEHIRGFYQSRRGDETDEGVNDLADPGKSIHQLTLNAISGLIG